MKILSIAPQPFFTPRGTPFSVYYRTMVSADLGHEVDILTYGRGQDVDLPGVRIFRIPAFNRLGEIKIGPSPLKLFFDGFMVLWTIVLLLRNKYDIVHAHEEAVFFCILLKPIFKFKLIYDMHSSLPQQLTNFAFSASKPLIRAFELLEKMSIEHSEAVITICPDLADYVDRVISDRSRHVMIENSIFDPVRLAAASAPAAGRGLSDARVSALLELAKRRDIVVYAGTLEAYQGIDLLIESFKIVAMKHPQAYLLIVGGSADQIDVYARHAASIGILDQVHFTGSVPQETARKLTRMARVQVSPRCAGTNTPLKIYEQLANNVPLVATNIYSHTQAIGPDVAFLVDPEPAALADGIIEALQSEDKRTLKVQQALAQYQRQYSKAAYTRKLRRAFKVVSQKSSPEKAATIFARGPAS